MVCCRFSSLRIVCIVCLISGIFFVWRLRVGLKLKVLVRVEVVFRNFGVILILSF